jgi:hypothetical protein
MPDSSVKSFLREWGVLIAFAALVVFAFAGFRLWTEHKANEPVSEAYRVYLSKLASNSKSAAAFLEEYYAKYSRRTVASKHFESVCGAVTVFADHDGFEPEKVSVEMARACRMFIREGSVTGTIP